MLAPEERTESPMSEGRNAVSTCISDILAVYNEATTIIKAAERVLAQPLVAVLLVVDDCSNDGTWERLSDRSDWDARLKLFRQPVNRGKGAAICNVLPHITARWVVIIDADLEYDPV